MRFNTTFAIFMEWRMLYMTKLFLDNIYQFNFKYQC